MAKAKVRAKVRALKVAAWPRALHAVAATTLSDAAFHTLCTGAVRGLNADGAGTNAWLQLGLIEHPLADPHFWAIICTLRTIRECGHPAQVLPRLIDLAHSSTNLPTNGISSTLLTRLHILGWHIHHDGTLQDVFGKFQLFDASFPEMVFRAQWSWMQVVAAQVAHRPALRAIHQADPWTLAPGWAVCRMTIACSCTNASMAATSHKMDACTVKNQ